MMLTDAAYVQKLQEFENEVPARQVSLQKVEGIVYKIPVVVHVMHKGETIGTGINVSDATIQAAIKDLMKCIVKFLAVRVMVMELMLK